MVARRSRSFLTLDMLRGLAAIAVLIGHSDQWVDPFLYGLFAVDLFFIMSGFVVAHAYEHRFEKDISVADFFVIRMIRLYPLYIAGTILGLLFLAATDSDKLLETAFFSALMLPTPGSPNNLLYPANPVAWSLFFEICINLFYAMTWRRWTIRALIISSAITFLFLLVCRLLFHGFDIGWSWYNAIGGLARVSYCFPMGVLLYRLWSADRLYPKAPIFVVLVASFAVLTPFPIGGSPIGFVTGLLVMGAALPLIVALAINVEPGDGLRSTFYLLGRASYPIYAIQMPLLSISAATFGCTYPSAIFTLTAIVMLSLLAEKIYDVPARHVLMRLFNLSRRP